MELQGTLVGSGDGQGQAGTAQLWLPPAHGAEAAACPATMGRETPPFSSPNPAGEAPAWRTAAARCGCHLCSRGCPCHGHLNLLRQPADRLYMKFQLPTLINFCVVTAHNGQDECQLGELLKHIKKSRHCIVFKGTFMSHPSAQRAETRVHFQGFITFGEVKQTSSLGFQFAFQLSLEWSNFSVTKVLPGLWEHMLPCQALQKMFQFFHYIISETINPWSGPQYNT